MCSEFGCLQVRLCGRPMADVMANAALRCIYTITMQSAVLLFKSFMWTEYEHKALDCVFNAIVLFKLLYGIDAWDNFITKEL